MKCTRCDRNIPDFLWIDGDHPVLTDKPMILRRVDHKENNTMMIIAEQEAKILMCTDVNPNKPPEKILNLQVSTPIEQAVFEALGAASACWENLEGAGVFESTRCKQIGEELVEYINSK